MARWRKAAEMTQAELGERLGGWSVATVSAAERSWDGKRIRQFDADEIVALAAALGVPLPAMFLPPGDDGASVRYLFHAHDHGAACAEMGDLFTLLLPEAVYDEGMGRLWREAFTAAVARYMDEERGEILLDSLLGPAEADILAARLERIRSQREAALGWLSDLDLMADAAARRLRRAEEGEDRP